MTLLQKISFSAIEENLFEYVAHLYQPNDRFPYPLQSGSKGSLLGTVFAALIAFMLRKEHVLPGRHDIIRQVIFLRDPNTGLFIDPDLDITNFLSPKDHSPLYVQLQTTYFCYACLHALGYEFDERVLWLNPLLEGDELWKWLDRQDWNNPWLASNIDMFTGALLLECIRVDKTNSTAPECIEKYFSWHDQNQNSENGFWGRHDDIFNAMAGGYHIILLYDYCQKQLNFINQIIDSTLRLQWRDGLFVYGGGGGSCEDMDAIDILVRLSLKTNYREKEIKQVLLRAFETLSIGQNADGGFSWRIQSTLRRVSRVSLNNGNLKGMIYGIVYKILHRSHQNSVYYYSSLRKYPFNIAHSDMWSSWFRPLALAFIARRYPESFGDECRWRFPWWPGLGFDPFINSYKARADQKKHG